MAQVVNFLCTLTHTGEEEKNSALQGVEGQLMKGDVDDSGELDVESFQRLVVSTRSVAITRPSNLAKYAVLPQQQETKGRSFF